MNLARREVHKLSVFKHQKAINLRFEGVLHETLIFFLAFKAEADTINPIVKKLDDRN